MVERLPRVPLARGQGLSIGITSYNGRVFVGLNADRDTVGDVEVLADLIEQDVTELLVSSR
jgi:diacylglycerol O-acyltransferase